MLSDRRRNLLCQGLTCVSPDGADLLLGSALNIAEFSQKRLPLLIGWVPTFEEAIDWLQFAYTADRTGDYVAPASTFLVQSVVLGGYPLLPLIWRHLCRRYPRAYVHPLPSTSTVAPLGPDYSDSSPIGRSSHRKDIDPGWEGKERGRYILGYRTIFGVVNNPPIVSISNLGVYNLGRTNKPIPS